MEKLHNEKPHNVYSSPNIVRDPIKENEIGTACNTH
jgi:hypothetical protein